MTVAEFYAREAARGRAVLSWRHPRGETRVPSRWVVEVRGDGERRAYLVCHWQQLKVQWLSPSDPVPRRRFAT